MKRIERLTYRLKLLFIIKCHNIVSMIYLKFVIALNSYKRYFIVSSFVIIDNEKKYEIERLIRKRYRRFDQIKQAIIQYLTR